ncbi:MAG: hypothetical protein RIE06_33800 [Roseibium album]|uniref:hypothetical protein n=1 Tax=Roseibium album TaxID=311410 RepID=UPI00131A5CB0|nr:hypothetical protein [Labrenzia sp. EL_142]
MEIERELTANGRDLVPQEIIDGALSELLGLTDGDRDVALGIANAKFMSGDFQGSFTIYSTLVLTKPNCFRCQQGMANFCVKVGEFEAALLAGSAMVLLEPDSALGYYFCGAANLALDCRSEAKEDISKAMRIAENDGNDELLAACLRLSEKLTVSSR